MFACEGGCVCETEFNAKSLVVLLLCNIGQALKENLKTLESVIFPRLQRAINATMDAYDTAQRNATDDGWWTANKHSIIKRLLKEI